MDQIPKHKSAEVTKLLEGNIGKIFMTLDLARISWV